MSTHAEQDIAELVAASPVVGFVAKLNLSADAVCDLLMTRQGKDNGSLSQPA
jgi:hypothetical protein